MKTYLDSTALLGRVTSGPDSATARESLRAAVRSGAALLTSELSLVELSRAARQLLPIVEVAEFERQCLTGVATYPIDAEVIATARRLAPKVMAPTLAIHLATAVLVSADGVLTFDEQLARACRSTGLRLTLDRPTHAQAQSAFTRAPAPREAPGPASASDPEGAAGQPHRVAIVA